MFDRQDQIDRSRMDPKVPEVDNFVMFFGHPVTFKGMHYPETLIVRIDEGRLPPWLAAYFTAKSLRRIQDRHGPDYGFVTDSYSCFGPDAYVARQPGDAPRLYRSLMFDARKNGWKVMEEGDKPAYHTSCWQCWSLIDNGLSKPSLKALDEGSNR